MKKAALLLLTGTALLFGCTKTNNTNTPVDFQTLEGNVLSDFVNKIAIPEYENLQQNTATLNLAINEIDSSLVDSNIIDSSVVGNARQAWLNTHQAWMMCEGFLFGPVESQYFEGFHYDQDIDSWPVSSNEIDSVVAADNYLQPSDVKNLAPTLRGLHTLENVLWATQGRQYSDSFNTPRVNLIVAVSKDLVNLSDSLASTWQATSVLNFQQQILQAGKNNPLYTQYANRQQAFLAIAQAMSKVCGQIADTAKIYQPYHHNDSMLAESPYSHNSLVDFTNDLIAAQNVYMCTFNGQSGTSLSSLVAAKNPNLDKLIQQQFTTAINSISLISGNYEMAIYSQPTQIQRVMDNIQTLVGTLDTQLEPYITTYVKD